MSLLTKWGDLVRSVFVSARETGVFARCLRYDLVTFAFVSARETGVFAR